LFVEITDEQIVVHASAWTYRYRCRDIAQAKVVRMRTTSPFSGRWPYVSLGLQFRDGRFRSFSDISAKAASQTSIQAIADFINNHCAKG